MYTSILGNIQVDTMMFPFRCPIVCRLSRPSNVSEGEHGYWRLRLKQWDGKSWAHRSGWEGAVKKNGKDFEVMRGYYCISRWIPALWQWRSSLSSELLHLRIWWMRICIRTFDAPLNLVSIILFAIKSWIEIVRDGQPTSGTYSIK